MIMLIVLCILILSSVVVHGDSTLRILTWDGYAPENTISEFQQYILEKYHKKIVLDINYVSHSDEYFEYIRLEMVDIVTPSHNIIKDERYKLIEQQLLIPFDLKNIPNYTSLIPSLQFADYTTVDGDVYSVPIVHGPYGLIYEESSFNSPPTSWSVLWNSKHQKKYTVSRDYFEANAYIAALSLGVPVDKLADIETLKSYRVKDRLATLAKNSKHMWRGVDKPNDMIGSRLGTSWGFSLGKLKSLGQHWKMANPKEGVTGWIDGYALVRSLKDQPELKLFAEEWVNFCIDKKFQFEVIVRELGSDPVNYKITDFLTKEEIHHHHLDDLNYYKNNRLLWPTLNRRSRNYLKMIWDNALQSTNNERNNELLSK